MLASANSSTNCPTGGDRFTAEQEQEKRMVGELWAQRSNGKGLYLMARRVDDTGRNVRDQLLAVIHSS